MAFILASSGTTTPTIYFLAGLGVVYYVLFFVFICALIISPIMIWKWTKSTSNEIKDLRSQLSEAEAKNIKYLKSINTHLERLNQIATAVYTEEEEEDNNPTRISIN